MNIQDAQIHLYLAHFDTSARWLFAHWANKESVSKVLPDESVQLRKCKSETRSTIKRCLQLLPLSVACLVICPVKDFNLGSFEWKMTQRRISKYESVVHVFYSLDNGWERRWDWNCIYRISTKPLLESVFKKKLLVANLSIMKAKISGESPQNREKWKKKKEHSMSWTCRTTT